MHYKNLLDVDNQVTQAVCVITKIMIEKLATEKY